MNATFTIPVKKGETIPINSFKWVAVSVRKGKRSWKVQMKKLVPMKLGMK